MDGLASVEDDGEKKRPATRTAAIPHTEEDGLNQDVLNKIFDKMDAQFLEIKETLYFRKIRDNVPPSLTPSRLVVGPRTKSSSTVAPNDNKGNSLVHPEISSAMQTLAADGNKGNTKVYPAAPRKTDGADSVSTASPSKINAVASLMKPRKGGHGIASLVNVNSVNAKLGGSVLTAYKTLRSVRPIPEKVGKLYRKQLSKVAGSFSEKDFTGHTHNCCFLLRCGRDLELDKFSRETLSQSLSPPVYYWLIFTGVIPTSCVPWLLPLLWCVLILAKMVFLAENVSKLLGDFTCNIMSDDCTSASRGLTIQGTFFIYHLFHLVSLSGNLFILAPLLQSRELRCLLSYVGHPRVRGSKAYNILLLASVILLLALGTVQMGAVVRESDEVQYQVTVLILLVIEIPIGMAAYSSAFVFWLMHNAVKICYADFAVDVLEDANQKLHLYSPGGNSEIILMNQLKRIISLSATVTERSRVALLLPLIFALVMIFWIGYAGLDVKLFLSIIFNLVSKVIAPAIMPVLLALLTTHAGDMLDRLVTLSQFMNLAEFVRNNPSEWMLSQRTPLSFALFGKLAGVVVLVGAVGGALRKATSGLENSPFWAPVHFDAGTCIDGQWTGFEQHVDCGGPRSGCPSTCVEKYGQYLLVEATRDCSDVDGYVEIRTQRACEIAYASFQRARTNASLLKRVPASVYLSSNNTDLLNASIANLRCGTGTEDRSYSYDSKMVIFPALLSASALDLASATIMSWRKDPSHTQLLNDKARGKQFAAGALCARQADTCAPKRPTDWSEALACTSEPAPAVNATWVVASQPWAYKSSTNILTSTVTYKKSVSVRTQGDCAHVKVNDLYGAHVVLDISCASEPRCTVTTSVRSKACSKVSALVSVFDATGRHENEQRELKALCGSQENRLAASRGDHVHIIADVNSGPFEIDLCV